MPGGVAAVHVQRKDRVCLQAPLINANNSREEHGNEEKKISEMSPRGSGFL